MVVIFVLKKTVHNKIVDLLQTEGETFDFPGVSPCMQALRRRSVLHLSFSLISFFFLTSESKICVLRDYIQRFYWFDAAMSRFLFFITTTANLYKIYMLSTNRIVYTAKVYKRYTMDNTYPSDVVLSFYYILGVFARILCLYLHVGKVEHTQIVTSFLSAIWPLDRRALCLFVDEEFLKHVCRDTVCIYLLIRPI